MSSKKILFTSIVSLVIILFAGIGSVGYVNDQIENDHLVIQNANAEESLERDITLLFVGDIQLSRAVGKKMLAKNDFVWPFQQIGEYTSSFDLTFGNLESPISSEGKEVGNLYSFRSDPRATEGLVFAGFDLVSLANNHVGDWGRGAMSDSLTVLGNEGIEYVGAGHSLSEARAPRVKEIHGVTFCFLGYSLIGSENVFATDELPGITGRVYDNMIEDVQIAASDCEVVITSMHFGDEYQTMPNKLQRKWAEGAVDAGATLVIGHHPHVVQPVEKYKHGYIAYSLGNFIFDQLFSEATKTGGMLEVVFKGTTIETINLVETYTTNEYQVFVP